MYKHLKFWIILVKEYLVTFCNSNCFIAAERIKPIFEVFLVALFDYPNVSNFNIVNFESIQLSWTTDIHLSFSVPTLSC